MLTTLIPPVGEPVSPAELKAFLRVTHDAEDDLLSPLIAAARERLEAELGVRVAEATLRETFPAGDRTLTLSVGPVIAVEAVALESAPDGWTVLPPDAWRRSGDRPARVRLPRPAPARIDYVAGWAAEPEDVPASLKQAVLVLAAEAYERRDEPLAPVPPGLGAAEAWAAPFRRARL